jgi:hypothetical protein
MSEISLQEMNTVFESTLTRFLLGMENKITQ